MKTLYSIILSSIPLIVGCATQPRSYKPEGITTYHAFVTIDPVLPIPSVGPRQETRPVSRPSNIEDIIEPKKD